MSLAQHVIDLLGFPHVVSTRRYEFDYFWSWYDIIAKVPNLVCNEKCVILQTNHNHVVRSGSSKMDWRGGIEAHQDVQVEYCPFVCSSALRLHPMNGTADLKTCDLSKHI